MKQAPEKLNPSPSIQDLTKRLIFTRYYSELFRDLIYNYWERYVLTEGMLKSIDITVKDTGIKIPGWENIPIFDIL